MSFLITQGLGSDGSLDAFQASGISQTPTYVDVTFNDDVGPLELQAADPAYWVFTTDGNIEITATEMLVMGDVVRIYITEPKAGDEYTLTLPDNGLRSLLGTTYDGVESFTFTAVATAPTAASARSLDARRVRVIFSEPVIEADALTVVNYSITSPVLAVTGVTKETDSTYVLTTAPQTPGQNYTLTVYNVRDQSENPV